MRGKYEEIALCGCFNGTRMGLKASEDVEPKEDHCRQAETCAPRVLECRVLLVLCFREGKNGSLDFWVGVLVGGLQLDGLLTLSELPLYQKPIACRLPACESDRI